MYLNSTRRELLFTPNFKAERITEAGDHHCYERGTIFPTVNCFVLADILYCNNKIYALIEFEFCLALRIIVSIKLQPVSYRTLQCELVYLFEL